MRTTAWVCAAICALTACGGKGGALDELTASGGPGGDPGGGPGGGSQETGDEPTSSTDATTEDEPTTGEPAGPRPLDVLFVIDNSGSMADAQSLLALNIGALEQSERDLRVGITTTDSGNPRCPGAQTTPEGGTLQTQSCVERVAVGEFTFDMLDYSYGCTDVCAIDYLTTLPTATAYDEELVPRPWFERTAGVVNVEKLSLTQALQCALPQGVSGCGFEQPLESMYRALVKSQMHADPQYGFLRDEADLVVVIVTDEVDCSHNPKFVDIFSTNKVFWSDPDRPDATSAVCFNAGVRCDGAGPTYTDCRATNYGSDGTPGVADDEAVLQPVSRYATFLSNLAASKRDGATVRLLAIAGVPVGFESGTPLEFADDPDTNSQDLFGIGPGCIRPQPSTAEPRDPRPPMRMLDVAAALGPLEFYSICEDSFAAAVAAIVQP